MLTKHWIRQRFMGRWQSRDLILYLHISARFTMLLDFFLFVIKITGKYSFDVRAHYRDFHTDRRYLLVRWVKFDEEGETKYWHDI